MLRLTSRRLYAAGFSGLALALALTMFGLAGCGGNNGASTTQAAGEMPVENAKTAKANAQKEFNDLIEEYKKVAAIPDDTPDARATSIDWLARAHDLRERLKNMDSLSANLMADTYRNVNDDPYYRQQNHFDENRWKTLRSFGQALAKAARQPEPSFARAEARKKQECDSLLNLLMAFEKEVRDKPGADSTLRDCGFAKPTLRDYVVREVRKMIADGKYRVEIESPDRLTAKQSVEKFKEAILPLATEFDMSDKEAGITPKMRATLNAPPLVTP